MIVQTSDFVTNPVTIVSTPAAGRWIQLADGSSMAIDSLSLEQLIQLQCEQEPQFAKLIATSEKNSIHRAEITQTAYGSICAILDEQATRRQSAGVFSMGMDARYADLVLSLLESQRNRGISGGLFELGCSAGALLGQADQAGYRVGGLEVVPELLDRAREQIASPNHHNLFLGDFRKIDLEHVQSTFSVAYWNDVFEHIPVDEIHEYLTRLYGLLKPGGVLVTITPNWHMRPSDVTMNFRPPRSQAEGFHLKEYTLGEVCNLLHAAGFSAVQTPAFISRNKIHLNGFLSLTDIKCVLEPMLEWLPFRFAVQICRRLGFSCTIAVKSVRS
ncbi:MAG: class I SAM-dependent methyltransferase [Pirellulales bacterium]